MSPLEAAAVRYVSARSALGCNLDASSVFEAMVPDLLHDGDVDLAMQKAFRWGFEDADGDKVPGLRDLTQRLRDDRQALETAALEPEGDVGRTGETADVDEPPVEDSSEQQHLAGKLETLEQSLRQLESLDDLKDLDPDLIDTVLNDEEREWVEQWMQMEGLLEAEGFVVPAGDRLELTPRAVRRIGERVLREIFKRVRGGSTGSHEAPSRSRIGVPVETSSPWQYGDPFALNLPQTVMNSIRRQGPGTALGLRAEDFEVYDRESLGASATVLLIDMSRSMFYNGCWDAAKRSALALDTLIRSSYQRDDLEIVGFSERAERLTLTQLPSLEWNEYSHGTNLQDGLRTARQVLRSHRNKTRQVLLLTDGEPTAWLDGEQVRFEHPPTERVFDATLREVQQCNREGVVINILLLDDGKVVSDLAERVARMNGGRLIRADARNLGSYVLRDFVEHRTKRLR